MAAGFQSSAFQNNAFQNSGVAVVVPSLGGGGHVGGRRLRRPESGIYWPRKTKRKDEKEIIAEVLEEALEQMPVAQLPRSINVGTLATAFIETYSYTALRRIKDYETLANMIQRELDEQEDEETLLLLL